MKSSKTWLALLLTALMLAPSLTACSGSDTPPADTTAAQTTAPETTTAETTTVPVETSAVPDDLDFDGKIFRTMAGNSACENYYIATELTGDSMNDSLYERYQTVGDQLDVKFEFQLITPNSAAVDTLINTVAAGDDEFQFAIVQRTSRIASIVEGNIVCDWNDLPYIDLDSEYWYQSAIDSLRIGDSVYYTYGDIYPLSAHVFYYNKTIASDYNLESPHDLVFEGKWTLDRMIEMSTQVSKDLNGDGILNESDQYGISFASAEMLNSLIYGCGLTHTEKSGTDVTLRPYTEKTIDVFNKIYKLVNTGDTAYVTSLNAIKFTSGQLLFCTGAVHGARSYRDTEVDFGMLPYPKYDEEQEHYISFLNTELMCVPTTVDKKFAGAVIQLMAEESDGVKTAYYEYLLKGKVARDEESEQILDMVFDHAVGEFLVSFCCEQSNCKKMCSLTSSLVLNGNNAFVSQYESIAEAVRNELKEVCDMIRKKDAQ